MAVCVRLKLRSLWVDQLCIDQENPDEVLLQITQMDRIYQSAALTLVAMAGDHADHGLPGISIPRSWNHTTVEVHGMVISNTAPSLPDLDQFTTWSSRGWTL